MSRVRCSIGLLVPVRAEVVRHPLERYAVAVLRMLFFSRETLTLSHMNTASSGRRILVTTLTVFSQGGGGVLIP